MVISTVPFVEGRLSMFTSVGESAGVPMAGGRVGLSGGERLEDSHPPRSRARAAPGSRRRAITGIDR
jgi:hypothetical protein